MSANLDTLIYCSDMEAFKTQLKADNYYDEESKAYTVNYTLTPIKYNGNTSLSYVRNFNLDLSVYTMLEDLGDYDEMKADTDKLAKYKSVYPYDTPVEYQDTDGTTKTITLPFKIGVFA